MHYDEEDIPICLTLQMCTFRNFQPALWLHPICQTSCQNIPAWHIPYDFGAK